MRALSNERAEASIGLPPEPHPLWLQRPSSNRHEEKVNLSKECIIVEAVTKRNVVVKRGKKKKVSYNMDRKKRKSGWKNNDELHVANLGADYNSLAPGLLLFVDVLVLGGAFRRVVAVSAARSAAVELDSVAGPRDAVPFAGAAAASRAHTRRRRRVGGPRCQRRHIGVGIGIEFRVVVFGDGSRGRSRRDGVACKLGGQCIERALVVLGLDDLARLMGSLGLGRSDLGG